MAAVRWGQGFRRLTLLASGILFVLGLVVAWPNGNFLLVLVLAAIPWAIYWAVSWLARGFAPKPDPVEAMKLVDDLVKRKADGEITSEMVEEVLTSLPREQLLLVQRVHADKLKALDDHMLGIVTKGAREGKTISREKMLKDSVERRSSYVGPDREAVVADLDVLINEIRSRFPEEIPADDAYRLMRELENRGRQSG